MSSRKKSIIESTDKELIFYKQRPKSHLMSQNRVRLTDEAAEIIEKIYLETNTDLTQIASEMIIFASQYTMVKNQ